ncbi:MULTISPECIES: alpha/beta fold hydrolase [Nocardiopsis]|uniref:Alpha/beta hydrolase n=1 Tax=Nocardiopsis changdeensis TaxID=2831969 RepID=A0ABX8BWF1_9ACTN|nr:MULTISPECIES: alpha/beta hydrolase [Nocardiopsis]QUX24668.1 alpha/beta hydrolase [Nocardiopsis changdeensis]QYX35056.1 alpha/beta hydrolase [Nocardiopsis sp. MT53]
MYVRTFGPPEAPAVLLLHGGGVAGWMWDPLRERLGDGLRLIVPDLPGHGGSSGEPYRSHDRTVRELAGLLARENPDGPAAVVGFSLGAQLAVLLAASRDDLVDRAVVVSAQAVPTPFPALTVGLVGATAGLARRRWFARLQAKELFVPESLMEDYVRTSAGISRRTLTAAVGENIRFTVPAGWAGFPGRALVLAGERERGLMLDSARVLHGALPGSGLAVVGECGHGIPLQRPGWLAERLRAWL